MIFTFYPWKLDIDPEATKELYLAEDDTVDKKVNERFIQSLNEEQRTFFDALGVDLTKVRAEEKRHDISDERADADTLIMTSVDFLMKGKLLAIPDYQHSLYADEEVFGESFPGSVEVIKMPADQQLPFYDVDGMKIIFKHPYFHFDEEQYKSRDGCSAAEQRRKVSHDECPSADHSAGGHFLYRYCSDLLLFTFLCCSGMRTISSILQFRIRQRSEMV